MGSNEFEGDICDLSEVQVNLIRNVIEERGLKNKKIIIESVGKKGDNYVALVKRIKVETTETPFQIIAKIAPSDDMSRRMSNTAIAFTNEIVIYSEVLSKFKELLDSENIPNNERFRMPACYGFISEPPYEIILLEDLQTSGFVLMNRFKPLSNESIKLAVRDLAILHSLSYVTKHRHPEIYNDLKTKFVNIWAMMDALEESKMWLLQVEQDVISILENDNHKAKVKDSLARLTSNSFKQFHYDLESKFSVLQQGDCWTNNMLFRLEGEVPVECVLIDYQLAKIASPAADLLYLTLNCTDYQTRHKHQQEWLDYYHAELDKSLNNFGLQASLIYPREQLDADLKMNGKLAFGLSIILANIMARESEEALVAKDGIDLAEAAETFRIINLNEKTLLNIKKKVIGCIESCVEFGYL